MTFLQVWVAAVRESRKAEEPTKLSHAEAFPRTAAANNVMGTFKCRNQRTELMHGEFSKGSYALSPLSQ